MTTTPISPNPPPIFNQTLKNLPPHIVQSSDLQYLTCHKCPATVNLSHDQNYRVFLFLHAHTPQYPEKSPPKPWPFRG